MTKPFIPSHKFDLDIVFKVTRIIECFLIWNFWSWQKLSSLGLKHFYHECTFILWGTTKHTPTRWLWHLSTSQQQHTFSTEMNGMQLKTHIIVMSLQLIITKIDIQTAVVIFYSLFKYQVNVTSFLGLMDQFQFPCNELHCRHSGF